MTLAPRLPGAPHVTIVHPWDPWAQGIGGFDTCLDGYLRYAPRDWSLELIGLTTDSRQRPVGARRRLVVHDREVDFLPVFLDEEPDAVRPIPLIFRFAAACKMRGAHARGRIVQYHRFESALGLPANSGQIRVQFLHNHPREAVSPQSDLRWKRLSAIYHALLRRELARSQAIVGVDPRTAAWVATTFPQSPPETFWLPEWADPAVFSVGSESDRERERLDFRSKLALATESQLILFAGRFETQKDPLLLVEAFAAVAHTLPRANLVLVGKGRLREAIIQRVHGLGLDGKFRLLTPVDRSSLAEIYRSCDVVACSSAFEGGPRQVFEALACGTPVVSTDVGQVASVLRGRPDVGRLVLQRQPGAFASALVSQLSAAPSRATALRCAEAVAGNVPWGALKPIFDRYLRWLTPSGSQAGSPQE